MGYWLVGLFSQGMSNSNKPIEEYKRNFIGGSKMFNFITRKYKSEIKNLKHQIDNMSWEWAQEKELYDDGMIARVYEQKVDWTIGGLNMRKHKEVHRPIYGLDKVDASRIADLVKHRLEEQGIYSETSYHWRESDECYVIDVKVEYTI
jgi:hypothetical protein